MDNCDFKLTNFVCKNDIYKNSCLCETHFKQFIKFDEVTNLVLPEFTQEDIKRINQNIDISKKIGKGFTVSDILRINKKESGKIRTGFQINIGGIGNKTYFKFTTTNDPKWNLFYSKMLHSIKIWMGYNSIYEIQFNTNDKRPRRQPKETIIYEKEIWNGSRLSPKDSTSGKQSEDCFPIELYPIKGFEEEGYFITECGRVFSKKSGKIEEVTYSDEVYKRVYLYKNGKQDRYRVHRLVALNFVNNPNPEEYTKVNHLNGDKYDNRKQNLEWTNNKGNTVHAVKTGLVNKIKDQEFHNTVLTTWKKSTLIPHLYISEKGKMYNLRKNKIKEPIPDDKGRFCTSNGGAERKSCNYRVDKLVATEFCKRPEPFNIYKYVVHKDLDENNCCADNLYWSNKNIKCTVFVVNKDYDNFGPWNSSKEFPKHEFSEKGYIWSIKYKRLLNIKNVNDYVFCDIKYNKEKTQYSVSNLIWCVYNKKSILFLKENKLEVDHIDRNTKNNNLNNLRAVNKTVNCKNRKNTVKPIMLNQEKKEIKKYDCIQDCINDNKDLNFTYNGIYNSIFKGCCHKKHYFIR